VRLTQGAFSFLPDLNDAQIQKQVEYCISKGWAVNIEWTDDPHPRNIYWELWGLPLFDVKDPAAVMFEIQECRKANTTGYIKVQAFDASKGCESCVHSFIIQRPSYEPGFYVQRTEVEGRFQRYTIQANACSSPTSTAEIDAPF
jgi:ribulose-bisphosphate carboxylase small chain